MPFPKVLLGVGLFALWLLFDDEFEELEELDELEDDEFEDEFDEELDVFELLLDELEDEELLVELLEEDELLLELLVVDELLELLEEGGGRGGGIGKEPFNESMSST